MKIEARNRLQASNDAFDDYADLLDDQYDHATKKLLVQGARSQDWFHKLEEKVKKRYRNKYPGTKFVDKTHLKLPTP